jgi:hypothetical protein
MQSQDLKKHQWENRIIVVSSPEFDNAKAALQLDLLKQHPQGLKDRKLIIYHVTNRGYTLDFSSEIVTSENSEFEISEYNVSLIGLDGTEKFHATEPQPAETFFDLIDAMPMRQAEMDNN